MKLVLSIAVLLACCSQTQAEPMLCSAYISAAAKAYADKTVSRFVNRPKIKELHLLATGAYLARLNKTYSKASEADKTAAARLVFDGCTAQPNDDAWDVAVSYNPPEPARTVSQAVAIEEQSRPITQQEKVATISAKTIANGISTQKTELEQEAWWEENMAGRLYAIGGTIVEVEEGTFSGYWVRLDIGRGIEVRCGLDSERKGQVHALKKGRPFTCTGRPGNTWTSLFGTSFLMYSE